MNEPAPAPATAPRILFEDDQVLALFKPSGMHVFPARDPKELTVLSWLGDQRPALAKVGDLRSPCIVHRLDLETSGLLLAAKTDAAYLTLRQAFTERRVEKLYLALAEGSVQDPVDLDLPLGSRYRRSKKIEVAVTGKQLRGVQPAQTRIRPLALAPGFTLCQVEIVTGVRHQIRAHLAHLGHPVAGDRDYGARQVLPQLGERFFLHCWSLGFEHPRSGVRIGWRCPLSFDLGSILADLGFSWKEPLDDQGLVLV
jgi:23S rRNA pseudouridine1911/1915/1917 synthase